MWLWGVGDLVLAQAFLTLTRISLLALANFQIESKTEGIFSW